MSNNLLGALLMVASMVSFTINDTFLKLTDGALPVAQLLAVRGAIATVLIFVLARVLRGLRFDLGWAAWRMIILRALAETVAAFGFINALLHLPIANVSAILQALPLTVTLGAFLLFKDPIGWRRMGAILAGLVGMLLIVRPGPEGFSIWSLYALLAVLGVTARDLITRKIPHHVPSLTIAATNMALVATAFGAVSLTQPWQPVTPDLWKLLAGSVVFIIAGYYFSVQTMRVGEISFVAPFRYSSLIAALIIGWLVFDHWPDGLTLLGAAIVVGAGLFTLWRERQIRRS